MISTDVIRSFFHEAAILVLFDMFAMCWIEYRCNGSVSGVMWNLLIGSRFHPKKVKKFREYERQAVTEQALFVKG